MNINSEFGKEISKLLSSGLSKEKTVSIIAKRRKVSISDKAYNTYKSYVTMVDNAIKKEQKNVVIVTKKVKKPTYTHSPDGDKKHIQDRVALEVIKSNITSGLILTLSWIKCIVEIKINEKLNRLKFLSCERDIPTFIELFNEVENKGLKFMSKLECCAISRIIYTSSKDAFAHLLLDYCGTLDTFRKEVEYAIENKIVQKNGIIWLTFATRLGKGKKGCSTQTELKQLIEFAKKQDYIVVFEPINYIDSMGMCTVILKRIK